MNIDNLSGYLKSEKVYMEIIAKYKSRFMQKRQAPQEIIQPNEVEQSQVDEDEGWEDEEMKEEVKVVK